MITYLSTSLLLTISEILWLVFDLQMTQAKNTSKKKDTKRLKAI